MSKARLNGGSPSPANGADSPSATTGKKGKTPVNNNNGNNNATTNNPSSTGNTPTVGLVAADRRTPRPNSRQQAKAGVAAPPTSESPIGPACSRGLGTPQRSLDLGNSGTGVKFSQTLASAAACRDVSKRDDGKNETPQHDMLMDEFDLMLTEENLQGGLAQGGTAPTGAAPSLAMINGPPLTDFHSAGKHFDGKVMKPTATAKPLATLAVPGAPRPGAVNPVSVESPNGAHYTPSGAIRPMSRAPVDSVCGFCGNSCSGQCPAAREPSPSMLANLRLTGGNNGSPAVERMVKSPNQIGARPGSVGENGGRYSAGDEGKVTTPKTAKRGSNSYADPAFLMAKTAAPKAVVKPSTNIHLHPTVPAAYVQAFSEKSSTSSSALKRPVATKAPSDSSATHTATSSHSTRTQPAALASLISESNRGTSSAASAGGARRYPRKVCRSETSAFSDTCSNISVPSPTKRKEHQLSHPAIDRAQASKMQQ